MFNFLYNNSNSKNITVYENNSIELNCNIQGYPTPDIKLYFKKELLNDENVSPKEFENKIVYSISNINRSNNGTYSCQYNNSDSNVTVAQSIDVFVFCKL